MTLPGAPHLQRIGAELSLDGQSLDQMAREFGTPLYVYSQAAMLDALAAYQRALTGRDHLICYAMKANSNLAVVQTFARAGCGVDIVSGGELARALAAGVPASKIVFSGVGKTRAEMRRALSSHVHCFNVESVAEIDVLAEEASILGLRAPVSLRINPDVDAGTHPYISTGLRGNKFGIAHDEALAAYRRAAAQPSLDVRGVDCHIGSQVTQIEPYVDALDRLLDLVESVEAAGIPLHHIDVGGGLGIRYDDETPPPAELLVKRMLEKLDSRGHGHRRLVLEPGRSLVGNAGALLTEVLLLKTGATKSFCIVDAAMNDLMRPALYDAWMDIQPCIERSGQPLTYDIVGPVCESGDWLGRERNLSVRAGDVLAVLSAGAYGMAMASNYNTRPRAAEVLIVEGRPVLVREREQAEMLYAGEYRLP